MIEFGKPNTSAADDIQQIKDMSVLFGIQGSGMVNGLYASPFTAVVVVYPTDKWPISSGDPLASIKLRGPYQIYVNKDEKRLIPKIGCEPSSNNCGLDSEDFEMDAMEAKNQLQNALFASKAACTKFKTVN